MHLSELFPKLARLTDKFALIRSMHHTAPPIHEAGFQLLNTGRLFRDGPEWPSVGAVVAHLYRRTRSVPLRVGTSADAEVNTGISISHGQRYGLAGRSRRSRSVHGSPCDQPGSPFDTSVASECHRLRCRDSVTGFITINQFSTVFDSPSWDCHADGGSLRTDLNDIRDTVAPAFDTAFAALLTDLEDRGLLDTTLVVATGEFGRTPLLNANGGRDHWAGAGPRSSRAAA